SSASFCSSPIAVAIMRPPYKRLPLTDEFGKGRNESNIFDQPISSQIYLTGSAMADIGKNGSDEDFALAFGEGLNHFIESSGMQQLDAAKLLGVNKARLNTYCRGVRSGKRPHPNGEILYLACTKLPGFHFDFKGERITATTFSGRA